MNFLCSIQTWLFSNDNDDVIKFVEIFFKTKKVFFFSFTSHEDVHSVKVMIKPKAQYADLNLNFLLVLALYMIRQYILKIVTAQTQVAVNRFKQCPSAAADQPFQYYMIRNSKHCFHDNVCHSIQPAPELVRNWCVHAIIFPSSWSKLSRILFSWYIDP